MKNISEIKNCYGCGVCATICPKKIIQLGLNKHGFYEPHILDAEQCINCSLCINVCSYINNGLSLSNDKMLAYAAWSKDKDIRKKCSSGGIGFEIARKLIQQGYKVCGVKYNNNKERAEHYIATTIDELIPSIGSKYIQSYTTEGFKAINKKDKYLITGTPCQIDSFRRYIKKLKIEDNFVLLDFFCHGVPSMFLWKKYLNHVKIKTGNIKQVSWRNKFTGWHDSWAMSIEGEKQKFISKLSQGDIFYQIFLSDSCLGDACYQKCKFKYNKSSADIRIGDLWGQTYSKNEEGVSGVIILTQKGEDIIKSCNCELEKSSLEIVSEIQMKQSPQRPLYHKLMMYVLESKSLDISYAYFIIRCQKTYKKYKRRLKHPITSIKKIFKGPKRKNNGN